jgi:hypothetical protein
MILVAVVAVVVVILAYFGVAAAAKLPPFKATASSPTAACPTGDHLEGNVCLANTATPGPSVSPSPSASHSPSPSPSSTLTPLAKILPSYITGASSDTCEDEPSAAYVSTGVSDEELCDLSENSNVPEDYILYVGFPTETPASTYFGQLVTGNGMKTGAGDCSSLTLATDSDGSSQYCEDTYTTSSSSGSDFVFTGTANFDLGNDNPISSLQECAGDSTADVLAFTDPTYAAVGVAIACEGQPEYSELNSDFTAGDYFLGS